MTIELCIEYCQEGGYAYAGTEYGSVGLVYLIPANSLTPIFRNVVGIRILSMNNLFEKRFFRPDCDNAIQNGGTGTTGCSMMCSGDATEVCGGSWLLSIYYSNSPPGNLDSYAGWAYQGCYT
jgi:hypothetical protein